MIEFKAWLTDSVLYLKPSNVSCVTQGPGYTCIYILGRDTPFCVAESFAAVIQKIQEAT